MNAQRILIISYHFPPSGRVGGRRAARFAKWLARLGWRPTVLTLDDHRAAEPPPPSRGAESDDRLEVVRVRPRARWNDRLLELRRGLRAPNADERRTRAPGGALAGALADSEPPPRRPGVLRVVDSSLNLLEPESGWVWAALGALNRLAESHDFDCIWTSSPPHLTHLIALSGKRLFPDAVWVADFRDPWLGRTRNARPEGMWPPAVGLSVRLESWLEKKVMRAADAVTHVTANARDATRERYPAVRSRLLVLPNGIDSEELPRVDPAAPKRRGERFVITYLGTLYLNRDPRSFLHGLRRFVCSLDPAGRRVRVNLVGGCEYYHSVSVRALCRELGLEEVVRLQGFVPHDESMRLMRESDVLLLLAQRQPDSIPAKTYEYLWARTPILCICEPEGGTARLVEELGGGITVPPDDPEAVAAALARLHALPPGDERQPVASAASLSRFDAPRQTEELVELIVSLQRARGVAR